MRLEKHVKNFKEFVEAGTPYRFSTTHPFA